MPADAAGALLGVIALANLSASVLLLGFRWLYRAAAV